MSLDTVNGEVLEHNRLITDPLAFKRRFSGVEPLRIVTEAGIHSPWMSRLLEDCDNETAGRTLNRYPQIAMSAITR